MKKLAIASILATTILAAVLVSSSIVPSGVQAQKGRPGESTACMQFTKDGEAIGERICNDKANDVHVAFRGEGFLQFTKDGEATGDSNRSPQGANDFDVKWNTRTGEITRAEWTKNGQPGGQTPPVPGGSNDFEFTAKRVVLIVWTLDGTPLGDPVPAPAGANDVEFDVVVLPQPRR